MTTLTSVNNGTANSTAHFGRIGTFCLALWLLAGCYGLTGIEPSDLSGLRLGATREQINAILGDPIETETSGDGRIETYGYDRGNRPILTEMGECRGYGCGPYVFAEALMLTPVPHALWYYEQRGQIRVAFGPDDRVIGFPSDGLPKEDQQTAHFLENQQRFASWAVLDMSRCQNWCWAQVLGSLRQSDRVDKLIIEAGTQRVVFGGNSDNRAEYDTADVNFKGDHVYRMDWVQSVWHCGSFSTPRWRVWIEDETTGAIVATANRNCP